MTEYVIYTEVPAAMEGEVDDLEQLNSEGGAFRCCLCGHACAFSRMTNQYEYYACIECGNEVKVC